MYYIENENERVGVTKDLETFVANMDRQTLAAVSKETDIEGIHEPELNNGSAQDDDPKLWQLMVPIIKFINESFPGRGLDPTLPKDLQYMGLEMATCLTLTYTAW